MITMFNLLKFLLGIYLVSSTVFCSKTENLTQHKEEDGGANDSDQQNADINRPVNITITNVDLDRVTLEWDIEGVIRRNPVGRIYVTQEDYKEQYDFTTIFHGYKSTVSGLLPGTKYKFEVEVNLVPALRQRGEPVYATTLPVAPSIVSVVASDDDHNEVEIKCKVYGAPLPQVTWKNNNGLLPPTVPVNTTVDGATVTSVINLLRTPFVYDEYICLANNSMGIAAKTVTVPYNGNHPPVSLARTLMEISQDIKEIKEQQQANEDVLWRIFRHV